MIEIIGCILLIIIGISFICGAIDELKEKLAKYESAAADYEKTKFETEQLKKQVDEYKKLGFKYLQDKNNNLETQQKEFIKYLEDGIEKATINPYTKLSEYGMNRIHIYKEILQKYKSIIGDDK